MGLDGGLLICHQLWYFVWVADDSIDANVAKQSTQNSMSVIGPLQVYVAGGNSFGPPLALTNTRSLISM